MSADTADTSFLVVFGSNTDGKPLNSGAVTYFLLLASITLSGCLGGALSDDERSRYLDSRERYKVDTRGGEIGPEDVFEVRVYNEAALSGTFRVSPDGSVDFPLIGTVIVTGLRQEEVAGLIRSKLKQGFLKDPFVTVYVKEYNSKKVFVVGKVAKPGTFVYQDGMNIVQAITLAGGFSATAQKNNTIVTRVLSGAEQRIRVPVDDISAGRSANFTLAPGDIVFVPESVL